MGAAADALEQDDPAERDDRDVPAQDWDEMVALASSGEWEAIGLDPPDFQPASIDDFLDT